MWCGGQKLKSPQRGAAANYDFYLRLNLCIFCTSSNESMHNYLLYTILVVAFYTTTASLKRAAQSR